jgi:hypothetical protein
MENGECEFKVSRAYSLAFWTSEYQNQSRLSVIVHDGRCLRFFCLSAERTIYVCKLRFFSTATDILLFKLGFHQHTLYASAQSMLLSSILCSITVTFNIPSQISRESMNMWYGDFECSTTCSNPHRCF